MRNSGLTFCGMLVCIILLFSGQAYGTLIDFNDASDGSVINDRYVGQGVVFSCSGPDCTGDVFAYYPDECGCSLGDYDGNMIILELNECGFSETSGVIRADFLCTPNLVRIDVIADDDEDPSYLRAYNSSGVMIDEDTSNGGAEDECQIVTLEVSAPGIDYVVFSGVDGDTSDFDNLYFDCDTAIPTITQWGLIGLSILMSASGFWFVRRRRRA